MNVVISKDKFALGKAAAKKGAEKSAKPSKKKVMPM